jgi:hypothetical protein
MLPETFIFWYLDKEGDTGALRRTRDEIVQVEVPQCKRGNAFSSPERLEILRENAMQQEMVTPSITKHLSVEGKWVF